MFNFKSLLLAAFAFIAMSASAQTQYCANQQHLDGSGFVLCLNPVNETGYFIYTHPDGATTETHVTVHFISDGFYVEGVVYDTKFVQGFQFVTKNEFTGFTTYSYEYDGETYHAQFFKAVGE